MSDERLRGAAGAAVQAQAKVNLRLRILAREATGYHQLETLFLRLALADTVRVRVARSRTLDVRGLALGPTEQNLAWRAAVAYADAAGWPGGFAIELEKRIPVGGGLGGGSADAGAVLRALDALAPSPLGREALLRLAAPLGADVPFLATEHPFVLAWGRGERMLPLAPPPVRRVLLVVPRFGVNTAEAYGWLAASRRASAAEAAVLEPAALGDWPALTALAVNDFQPVVAARHPEIAAIARWLETRGCAPAMLSGSGSVMFGVLPSGDVGDGDGSSPAVPSGRVIVTATADRVEPVVRLD